MPRITLTRKRAAIKLESATKATYYFQRYQGHVYKREVPVADMLATFNSDKKFLLRIDTETSKHTLTIIDQKNLKAGYEIEF